MKVVTTWFRQPGMQSDYARLYHVFADYGVTTMQRAIFGENKA